MDTEKVFFDTNIVLDILNAERTGHPDAVLIWKTLVLRGYSIVISEDMLSTIFYIEKNKAKTLEFFNVIQKRWEIVAFGSEIIQEALHTALEQTLDLEDTLQCLCAKKNGCETLISNDKKFVDCGMEIMSSTQYVKAE